MENGPSPTENRAVEVVRDLGESRAEEVE